MLNKFKHRTPIVHNITNYVVMDFTANALLAVGASPVMAHAIEEVDDMVAIADCLVVNIGTLSKPWVESMEVAMAAASRKRIPIVLDPVGAGATRLRTVTARGLIERHRPSILRGNASEILACTGGAEGSRGVDSLHRPEDATAAALALARQHGMVVCVSGATDFITDGSRTARISNGHPWMARVTGMGCTATALIGAHVATDGDRWGAVIDAMAQMGVCGELAAQGVPGLGSFKTRFMDALGDLTQEALDPRRRVEIA